MTATLPDNWHNRIFKNHTYTPLIACLVFAPLLFINVRNSIDWGDDNVQYIHQAKNIIEGIPQSQTGYVYNEHYPVGGPRAYPVGFPLLLAPAYALAGYNLYAFTFVIALVTFILALLMTLFFLRYFQALPAILLTSLFVYNPLVLIFKAEVMSDMPFGLFLVAATLLYTAPGRRTYLQSVFIAFIIGMLISLKSLGLIFPIAILADISRNALLGMRNKPTIRPKAELLPGLIMVIGGLSLFILLNMVIFRMPSGGGIGDYLNIFDAHQLKTTILQNLIKYVEVFRYMYSPDVGSYQAIALVAGCMGLSLLFFGMIRKLIAGFGFVDILALCYISVFLVYPYNAGALRFIMPATFLLLYYMALGLSSFNPGIHVNGSIKAIVAGSLMLILFLPGILNIIKTQHTILPGPQEKAPQETFSWIKVNTPGDAIIAFAKPRALAFYTDRNGFSNPKNQDIAIMNEDFLNAGVTYLLASKTQSDESFIRYIQVNENLLKHIWGNDEFDLYKLR
ncbi:MAG: hypothetical protein ACOYMF_01635 [Bacteroidales bacterium]